MNADCPFCRIIAGNATVHRLYEDEQTLAFLDIHPATTGHSLVIPKAHRTDILAANEQTLEPDGFSVFHSTGTVVGNVEHAHVHLLPRYEGDEITVGLERYDLPEDEGERLTEQVRTVLSVEERGEY